MTRSARVQLVVQVAVFCPLCNARADRMQRGAPGDRPGVFALYPCKHWLTPALAVAVRDSYRAQVAAQSADAGSAPRSAPTPVRSDDPREDWS